jgi:hypothetical protein
MKIPFDESATLEYLTQEEKLDNSWGDNLFGINAQIFSINELAKQYRGQADISQKVKTFKRSKLNLFVTGIVGVLFVAIISNILINHTEAGTAASLFLPLLILIIVISLLKQLFGEEDNLKIILTKDGMTIKGMYYPWMSVYKLYIIERSRNKSKSYSLVLALDTGTTDKYDITNLVDMLNSEKKISAYIDSYKNFA